jgi:rubrerythrin
MNSKETTDTKSSRLTYKSMFGDYGLEVDMESHKYEIMNKLGKLEDKAEAKSVWHLEENYERDEEWLCPNCHCHLDPDSHNNYCPDCGQRLKWD